MPDRRPIGVFDSGIGGLTVVRALMETLPGESLVYFGDTARVPYGPKSPATVQRFSIENVQLLTQLDVKAVVVACNTATAHALPVLEERFDLPLVGVVDPGAKAAVERTRSGRVGVIGTHGTVSSGAYERSIKRIDGAVSVISRACPLFVPLVEEGWFDHPAGRLIAEEYLSPFRDDDVDTLILGCTHYPLLKGVIGEILGPDVALVDSADEAAREVARLFDGDTPNDGAPEYRYLVSDLPDRFLEVGSRFLGPGGIDRVEVVRAGRE